MDNLHSLTTIISTVIRGGLCNSLTLSIFGSIMRSQIQTVQVNDTTFQHYFGSSALRVIEYRIGNKNYTVAFSYRTPIAMLVVETNENGKPRVALFTDAKKYSITTSRHMSTFRSWIRQCGYFDASEYPQSDRLTAYDANGGVICADVFTRKFRTF